jgi:hypothetical protein
MNTKFEFDLLKLRLMTNQYLDLNDEALGIYEEKYLFLKGLNGLLIKRIKELKLENTELKNELER